MSRYAVPNSTFIKLMIRLTFDQPTKATIDRIVLQYSRGSIDKDGRGFRGLTLLPEIPTTLSSIYEKTLSDASTRFAPFDLMTGKPARSYMHDTKKLRFTILPSAALNNLDTYLMTCLKTTVVEEKRRLRWKNDDFWSRGGWSIEEYIHKIPVRSGMSSEEADAAILEVKRGSHRHGFGKLHAVGLSLWENIYRYDMTGKLVKPDSRMLSYHPFVGKPRRPSSLNPNARV